MNLLYNNIILNNSMNIYLLIRTRTRAGCMNIYAVHV